MSEISQGRQGSVLLVHCTDSTCSYQQHVVGTTSYTSPYDFFELGGEMGVKLVLLQNVASHNVNVTLSNCY
jgi:hypothetical protein